MSRQLVIIVLTVALTGLLLGIIYYFRELKRAYLEDMKAKRASRAKLPEQPQ